MVADCGDLNGDGLPEILCITQDKEGRYFTLFLKDTFSHPLWNVLLQGSPSSLHVEDLEGDGTKEVLLTLQLPSPPGICLQKWNLLLITSKGYVQWMAEVHFDHVHSISVADINRDGCSEIMAGNAILDRNGKVISDFGEFSVTRCIQRGDSVLLVLEKVTGSFGEGYTDHFRIVAPEGKILWERVFSQPVFESVHEVEHEKRLFLLQQHALSEVDLVTFVENPRIRFDFDDVGDFAILHFNILDLNGDGEKEYLVRTNNLDLFENDGIYVFDSQFYLVWEYTDPTFTTGVLDLDRDGKWEFVIVYDSYFRVLNSDGSVRWSVYYKSAHGLPMLSDIDADGDTEIGVNIVLEDGEDICILGPDGTVEKQLKSPQNGVPLYEDLDGDGDTDMLWCFFGGGVRAYANTRVKGPLDAAAGEETLEEVSMGEGIKRDYWVSPALYYGWKRLVSSFESPRSIPSPYAVKGMTLLSLVVVACAGLFLERRRKMRENVMQEKGENELK